MSVKISPKYQVVIPEAVREALGLRAGSKVDVIAKGKVAFLVPVPELSEVQQDLKGKLNAVGLRDKKDRAL